MTIPFRDGEKNEIVDKESKLLKNHLNDNYDEILTLCLPLLLMMIRIRKKKKRLDKKANQWQVPAQLLLDLFQEQEPAAVFVVERPISCSTCLDKYI